MLHCLVVNRSIIYWFIIIHVETTSKQNNQVYCVSSFLDNHRLIKRIYSYSLTSTNYLRSSIWLNEWNVHLLIKLVVFFIRFTYWLLVNHGCITRGCCIPVFSLELSTPKYRRGGLLATCINQIFIRVLLFFSDIF